MLRKALMAGLAAGVFSLVAMPALALTSEEEPKHVEFGFEGPLGKFDRAAVQRGFKVYAEVCASCHSMNLLYYRNLAQKGGPFYEEKYPNPNASPYAKAIAAAVMVPDIDQETGDAVMRAATPADHFKSPFANEVAARASNGGAMPPDLSVIAKAREGGPAYVYSILTGFTAAPHGMSVPPGKYYNPYMPGDMSSFWSGSADKVPVGGFIAMPPPLKPNLVTFDDGKPSTVEQEAKDVSAFLSWASEPKMEERKQFGLGAMIYLLIFSGLLYASYRKIWKNVSH